MTFSLMTLGHYAEFHDLFIVMVNVVMLSIIRLCEIRLNVIMLSVMALLILLGLSVSYGHKIFMKLMTGVSCHLQKWDVSMPKNVN